MSQAYNANMQVRALFFELVIILNVAIYTQIATIVNLCRQLGFFDARNALGSIRWLIP